jgi:2-hydroxychromene-2-carboxylate isomerase
MSNAPTTTQPRSLIGRITHYTVSTYEATPTGRLRRRAGLPIRTGEHGPFATSAEAKAFQMANLPAVLNEHREV